MTDSLRLNSSAQEDNQPLTRGQTFIAFWRRLEPWIATLVLLITPAEVFIPGAKTYANLFGFVILVPLVLGCWKRFLYASSRDLVLLLLVCVAFASLSWSVAPGVTENNLRGLMRTMAFGAYLAARFTVREQVQILSRVFLIWGGASIVSAIAIPSYGLMSNGEWKGVFGFKNGLGAAMSLGGSLALLNLLIKLRQSWKLFAVVPIAIAVLILTKSSTSILAFAAATLIVPVFLIVRRQYKIRVILSIFCILLYTSGVIAIVSSLEFIVVNLLGKQLTLTGRLPLWQAIISVASERPWLGFGYGGAFWNSLYGYEATYRNALGWPTPGTDLSSFHSHNGFIELFTQLGWLGLGLMLLHFLLVFLRVALLIQTTKSPENFWLLQFLVVMIVFNSAEVGSFLEAGQFFWMVYVAIALSTRIQLKQLRRERQFHQVLMKSE